MTKAEREAVYNKYDRHCAYCGREIEYKEMQVDHLHPQHLANWTKNEMMRTKYNLPYDVNNPKNLLPACRRCNYYKGGHRLETFRREMKTLYKRIRTIFINKVAIDYGIIELHTWDGVFYFEKHEPRKGN